VTQIPRLLNAFIQRDANAILQIYATLGLQLKDLKITEQESFYRDLLEPFGRWLTEPFKAGTFDFGSWSSPYTKEGLRLFRQISQITKVDETANEFIYFDRTIFGLYQIFERMQAQVNMEHKWLI
jgi:hypothetical protein